MEVSSPQFESPSPRRWWREGEIWLLMLLVGGAYFTRLDGLTIRGEESRRARVAYEMLETGDWIVPRQQGGLYLSRPPLGNWLIAGVGYLRGEIDTVAVRLPSAAATAVTVLLIYIYCRAWLSRSGAFAGALVFATMAMVLELGRLGETEAVLAACVAGSLLIWHLGYQRKWPAAVTWCGGYACAALAALAKGPQGPVYFGAAVVAYLIVRRDWRFLLSRAHGYGLLTFAVVVGAWQIPFAWATDWRSVQAISCANAAERFVDDQPANLVKHLLVYPVELFCCLLPWSLPLVYLANRRFWRSLADVRPWILFSLVAIGVCFPTVLFAAGAKGRYFMPLFPCFAVLTGVVIERCWSLEPAAAPRRAWNQFLAAVAVASAMAGLAVAVVSWAPPEILPAKLTGFSQPPLLALFYLLLAAGTTACLFVARGEAGSRWGVLGLSSLMLLLAASGAGVAVNVRGRVSEDTQGAIAQLKGRLPADARLVSLGEISHVFAYYFGGMIPAVAWPTDAGSVASEIDYFCFNQLDSEHFEFPFPWETVAVISLDRVRRPVPERTVVVGRRTRPATELAIDLE